MLDLSRLVWQDALIHYGGTMPRKIDLSKLSKDELLRRAEKRLEAQRKYHRSPDQKKKDGEYCRKYQAKLRKGYLLAKKAGLI